MTHFSLGTDGSQRNTHPFERDKMLGQLVERLLDPRCANMLPFLGLSWRAANGWMLPVLRAHPELLDWVNMGRHYKPWMRELVAETRTASTGHRYARGQTAARCNSSEPTPNTSTGACCAANRAGG